MQTKINIALVDDHILLRNGLAALIASFGNYELSLEANNGKEFIGQLQTSQPPDIVLLDINMPEMDGYETCQWITQNLIDTKVLALSMYDNEQMIIRMFKAGAKGYILKDCEPLELRNALASVASKGFYYSELITGKLIHSISKIDEPDNSTKTSLSLNDRETTFLRLVCSELTYKEIADRMCLSARTIDGYREQLFEKLQVRTRVGLVMFAMKNRIIQLDQIP